MERKEKLKVVSAIWLQRQQLFKKKLKVIMSIQIMLNSLLQLCEIVSKQTNRLHAVAKLLLCRTTVERLVWKFDRSSQFWEEDVAKMSNKHFKDNFRVSRESFKKICEKVKAMEKKDTQLRLCIPLEKRVGIALYALGSSSEYRTVAHLFGVGVCTVGRIVLEFCDVVCENFNEYISTYPPTADEIKRIVDGFDGLGFPQCFGAIDGCQFEVQPHTEEAVDFYNYKGWYSIILLASCDHRSKFTYFNIGSPGRNNDSYLFERSSLKKFHENSDIFSRNCKTIGNINVPLLLIGDSAFRLSKCVMKPFPFKLNQPPTEKLFNYRLSKCRRVIENAFGQLKARFRKVGRGLEVNPENCKKIIKSCCLLHNFLKTEKDDVTDAWMEEYNAFVSRIQPNETTRSGENNEEANTIRNGIALSFYEEVEGSSSGDNGDVGIGVNSTEYDSEGDGNGFVVNTGLLTDSANDELLSN